MSLFTELVNNPPKTQTGAVTAQSEVVMEAIFDLFEAQDAAQGKLNLKKVHTVVLSPEDGLGLKDKVFGIRNEDPIVAFMLDIMGVPRDNTPIRIRSGFMKYDTKSKILFIAKFKSDLPQ
jgi:hypothetical protein